MVVPGTNCSQKKIENYFGPKKVDLEPRWIVKKNLFLNIFHKFLGVFVPVPNAKKWFFWDLEPVLKWKIKFLFLKYFKFTFSAGTKSQKNRWYRYKDPEKSKKKFKKSFFGYLYRSKYLFFDPKKCLKNFGAS